MTERCHRHPGKRRPCQECAKTRPAVIQAAYDALRTARARALADFAATHTDRTEDQ